MIPFKEFERRKSQSSLMEALDPLTRYIPTGSKVETKIKAKAMTIKVSSGLSGHTITENVQKAGDRIKRSIDSFIKDVEKEIDISDVMKDRHVFIYGNKEDLLLTYEFTLKVRSSKEAKKFVMLDKALDFQKKYKL